MRNIAMIIISVLVLCGSGNILAKSIESIRSIDINFTVEKVVVPVVKPVVVKNKINKEKATQDIKYRFEQIKDEIWRFKTDTTWLRNDIERLEREARNIANGQSNSWFSYDLRNMAYKMNQHYNDIRRIEDKIKELISVAEKDKELNKIARDIEWYASDIENNFIFNIENAARNLEYTVRSIDPKIIGYDAQWNAYDIARYARDISGISRNIYWDARDLVNKTTP